MQVANVGVLALPQRTYEVVFFIEPIRVTENFISRSQVLGAHALTEKRTSVSELMWLETGKVEDCGPKINEANKAIGARTTFVIDEVGEVFWDAHHQWHVQAALIGVSFATRQHAAVVAEVKYERVLQQAIGRELFHNVAEQTIDDLNAVEVSRVGIAKDRCVRMIRSKFHLGRIVLSLFILKHLPRKMK